VNFSISEIMVVLLIALLVIKPEQLPGVAFTLGKLMQTLRRMLVKVKGEVDGLVDSVEKPSVLKHEQKREQQ
jgi:sec-independent protein translocase protein TatB